MGKLTKKINKPTEEINEVEQDEKTIGTTGKIVVAILIIFLIVSLAFYGFAM